MNFVFKLSRWIPFSLSLKHKLKRTLYANFLLQQYASDPFMLSRLITGDEKQITFNNSTRTSTWCRKGEPPTKIAKKWFQQKVMLLIWWGVDGVYYHTFLPHGQTINQDYYCQELQNLKNAIHIKKNSLNTRLGGVLFHHDGAPAHRGAKTEAYLKSINWQLLAQPPHSPDLAPSDFYLFRDLQSQLNSTNTVFHSRQEVVEYIDGYIQSKPKEFWSHGIESLVGRWRAVVNSKGEYFE